MAPWVQVIGMVSRVHVPVALGVCDRKNISRIWLDSVWGENNPFVIVFACCGSFIHLCFCICGVRLPMLSCRRVVWTSISRGGWCLKRAAGGRCVKLGPIIAMRLMNMVEGSIFRQLWTAWLYLCRRLCVSTPLARYLLDSSGGNRGCWVGAVK